MSITTELSRIQANRNTIRAKLVELGMATSVDKLDALASAIEGIVNRGAVSVEILEGTTYTIPAGYHNGSGVVKAMTDTVGESEKYKTQAKTVTPTTEEQIVTPDDGYYALSSVTIIGVTGGVLAQNERKYQFMNAKSSMIPKRLSLTTDVRASSL